MNAADILGALAPQLGAVLDLSRPYGAGAFPRCPQLADTTAGRMLAAIRPRHRLATCFNRFLDGGRIEAESGAVVFLEEAQNVRYWGVPLDRLGDADPPVVSTANDAHAIWEPEALRLSGFLQLMLSWQAVNGGLRHQDSSAELGRRATAAATGLTPVDHGVDAAGLDLHAVGDAGVLLVDAEGLGYLGAPTARAWSACRRAMGM